MLGLFNGGPVVDYLGHEQNRLIFQSQERPQVGRRQKIRLRVPDGQGRPRPMKVQVNGARALEGGGYVCTALVERGKLEQIDPSVSLKPGLRKTPRTECEFVVRGAELPGNRATVVDVSYGGMQLYTSGTLQVGRVLDLEIGTGASSPGIWFQARVAWSTGNTYAGFRAGVEYAGGDLAGLARLTDCSEDAGEQSQG